MPRALRVTLALVAALVLWFLLAPRLHAFLGSVAAPLFRGSAHVMTDGRVLIVWALDHPDRPARVHLAPVTTNLVILAALWAWDARAYRGRGLARLAAAAAILILLQIAAVCTAVHATLAVTLSATSGARYGTLAANLWLLAWQGYQIVGAPAAAFAAWWALRPAAR